jgi:hypothetical protein
MRPRKQKPSEREHGDFPAPPPGPAWHTRAIAIASGAAVVALPLIDLEFWPGLIAGEAVSAGVSLANRRGDEELARLLEWHMDLVRREAGTLIDALTTKPAAHYTDADRIQLALLADWGLIDETRAQRLSPAHQAEILFTQLLLGCKQQGIGIIKMAEHFSLPRLDPGAHATPEGLEALAADRDKLRRWKTTPPDPFFAKLRSKTTAFASGFLPGKLKRAVPIGFELPSLKKLWKVATAKGPAATAQDFMNRTAREMQRNFDSGFATYRCAVRKTLRRDGIPHESLHVPKTGGGRRFIVRRKRGPGPQ